MMRDELGSKCGTSIIYLAHVPVMFISDVKKVQELYTTQNKYFDKFPLVRDVLFPITGWSILFAETGENWRKRRAALTPTFYKGKLISMINMVKQSMQQTLELLIKKTQEGGGSAKIEYISEISNMFARIILTCAIGESLDGVKVDWYEKGQISKKDVPFALRDAFGKLLERNFDARNLLFPSLINVYLLPVDRELKTNCNTLRLLFQKMVNGRKEEFKNDPEIFKNKGDLLSILITDELFCNNNEMMVDECLNFFFAGS